MEEVTAQFRDVLVILLLVVAVLGANDGIVSTASLVVGVAAAGTARKEVLIAGTTTTRDEHRLKPVDE